VAINLWLGIGAILYNKPPIKKPVSIEQCFRNNSIIQYNYTTESTTTTTATTILSYMNSSIDTLQKVNDMESGILK
jgi:hypothetical protein